MSSFIRIIYRAIYQKRETRFSLVWYVKGIEPSGVERTKRKVGRDSTCPFANILFSSIFFRCTWERQAKRNPDPTIHKEYCSLCTLVVCQPEREARKVEKKAVDFGPVSTVQLVPSKHQHLRLKLSGFFYLSQFIVNIAWWVSQLAFVLAYDVTSFSLTRLPCVLLFPA